LIRHIPSGVSQLAGENQGAISLTPKFTKEPYTMNTPANLKYTKSDEWFDPATGAMGITDYAQSQLSDIVFVELLVDEGDTIEAGKPIASVESVKASAEIYASAGGTVSAVNKGLSDKPESLNSDPFGEAWMIKVEGGSAGDVMDAAAYEKYCEERAH
jgi:glycine cleavage system H protein